MDHDETPDERRERQQKFDAPFDLNQDLNKEMENTVWDPHVCPFGNRSCGHPYHCEQCRGQGNNTDFDQR